MKRPVPVLLVLLLIGLFFWSAARELSAGSRVEPGAVLGGGSYQDPPTTVVINCKKIKFQGVQYNPGNTTTWLYYVEELPCGQDLENWILELPSCTLPISGNPNTWQYVDPDPNYLLTGIKWDVEGGFEEGAFTVTINGHWAIGTTRVGVEGPNIGIGLLAGPVCVTPSPTPTNTSTPTSTPSVTPTNTPQPPTPTPSATPTFTPQPPTPTPPPPTATPVPGSTNTPQGPTLTPNVTLTSSPQPPTPTPPQPTVTATQPGPTMTATPTLPPSPFNRQLLPAIFYKHSPGEPNNSCPDAFNISTNNTYNFYPDDSSDWYTFLLTSAGNVTVSVDNFTPLAGQVAVYRGSDCGNLLFLGSDGDFSSTKIVELGAQPTGRFFIFVANDGASNNSTPYQLEVVVTQ